MAGLSPLSRGQNPTTCSDAVQCGDDPDEPSDPGGAFSGLLRADERVRGVRGAQSASCPQASSHPRSGRTGHLERS